MARRMVDIPGVAVAVMTAVAAAVILMGMVVSIAMMAPSAIPVVVVAGQRNRADGQQQAEEQYLCHAFHADYSCWLNMAQVCNKGTEWALNPK